jgi:hypothetical protein
MLPNKKIYTLLNVEKTLKKNEWKRLEKRDSENEDIKILKVSKFERRKTLKRQKHKQSESNIDRQTVVK